MGGLLGAVQDLLGKMRGGSSDGDDEQSGKYLQYIQARWNDLKNAYVVYHQSIWQAYLFYANQSWIDWDDARKVWQPQQPTDEWVPRPRINRFSPTIDAIASNFYQIPEVEAIPKREHADEPQANAIANVCSDLTHYAVVKEGLKHQQGTQLDKAGMAAQQFVLNGGLFTILRVKKTSLGMQAKQKAQTTSASYCPICDKYEVDDANTMASGEEQDQQTCPECGNPLETSQTETMQPEMGPDGQPVQEEQFENEICCEIGNTLWAFPRPGALSMEDSPYLLWANRRTLDDIYFRWDFDAQADAIWPDGYSVTYEHALNFWYTGYSSSTIQVKDSCMVLEMYVEPSKVKDTPDGFYGVAINDRLAYSEPWDFPEHPLSMCSYLNLPSIFFARSVAFDLAEIQRELNAYESLIKLHAMVAAVDPVVVDVNTVVNEITGRADKIIKWRKIAPDSEPPHRMGSGKLDDGVYKQRESLHAEFQNISMAVNAFRGQQEGAVTAASAIQQLRSQAELMFSKPAANWRNFWRETLRKYVKFIQKYYTFEQLVSILGDNREEEIHAFMGADLDEIVDWMASDHGLPRTKDELRQEMMVMWDKGALDINDPAVRQKIYELFGETGMMNSFNKDATNARLENQEFKMGATAEQIKPQPIIEDMAVHMFFHKDQAKSADFRKWQPTAQQALIQHIMETMGEIQKQLIQAQMMQQGVASPPKGPQLGDNKNAQGQNPALAQTTPTPAGG